MLLYFSASGIGKGPQRIQRLSLDLTLKLSAHLLEGKPGLGGGGGWMVSFQNRAETQFWASES